MMSRALKVCFPFILLGALMGVIGWFLHPDVTSFRIKRAAAGVALWSYLAFAATVLFSLVALIFPLRRSRDELSHSQGCVLYFSAAAVSAFGYAVWLDQGGVVRTTARLACCSGGHDQMYWALILLSAAGVSLVVTLSHGLLDAWRGVKQRR